MGILIRNAQRGDASVLCEAEKAWTQQAGYLVSHASELKVEAFERKIQELSGSPQGLYIVATNDRHELVGHALLEPMGLKALAHVVRLTIVIHPGFEGQGLGKLLMEKIISWAQETDGVEKIELLVRATNERAIALYKKYGFVEEGRLKKRIKISNGKYIDDIAMAFLIE